MVKKRLSDLLREEVNKSDANQPDAKSDENQSADPSAKSAKSSTAESSNPSTPPSTPKNSTAAKKADAKSGKSIPPETIADVPAEAPRGEPLRLGVHPNQQSKEATQQSKEATQQSKEAEADPANGTAKRTSSTKADKTDKTELEGTIAQLRTELAAAQKQSQQQETQFAEQLDRLQTEMKRQQSVIDQLQAEVQHSKSLKAELEEARQVILKLSEINAKPIDAKYASSGSNSTGSNSTEKSSTEKSRDSSTSSNPTPSQPTRPAANLKTNGAAPPASSHHLYVKAGESKPIDPPSTKPATSRSGAPLVPAPSNAAEPELESKPVQFKMPGANPDAGQLAPPARHQQELRRILDHPTRPGALPPMPTPSKDDKKDDKKLSETDMGWVD